MTLTRNEAEAVCKLIEIATDGAWPQIVEACNESLDIQDLCDGMEKLSELGGVSMPFTEEDF